MNNFYVYVYLDPRKIGNYQYGDFFFQNEPFYIGKGKNDRCYYHIKKVKNKIKIPNKNLSKVKSILNDGFLPIVLKIKENLQESQALNLEIKYINIIGRSDLNMGPLMNQTNGGDGLINPSVETRNKMSENLKNSKLHKLACKNPERNKKISDALKGHIMYKNPIRNKKISDANLGKIGHSQSSETKEKISKNNSRYWKDKGFPILQYSLNDTLIRRWNSARHVERELGMRHDSITNCCKNKRKTAYNFFIVDTNSFR